MYNYISELNCEEGEVVVNMSTDPELSGVYDVLDVEDVVLLRSRSNGAIVSFKNDEKSWIKVKKDHMYNNFVQFKNLTQTKKEQLFEAYQNYNMILMKQDSEFANWSNFRPMRYDYVDKFSIFNPEWIYVVIKN